LKPLYLFIFIALSDAKPLRTFTGNALIEKYSELPSMATTTHPQSELMQLSHN
jgi:hypothetical protein